MILYSTLSLGNRSLCK